MSLYEFIGRLSRAQVHENDRRWMPKWLDEYASFSQQDSGQKLTLRRPDVLTFLQTLRDRGVPAWQRLQATRTLDWYQSLVWKQQMLDFSPFLTKLQEIAERERRSPEDPSATIRGEGEPGVIDETEPISVQQLRRKMRVLHHPRSTENTYAGWMLGSLDTSVRKTWNLSVSQKSESFSPTWQLAEKISSSCARNRSC